MAQKTIVKLIDDIDGSEADESLTFGLDGVEYEIDLTAERAEELRSQLNGWISHARRVPASRRNSRRTASTRVTNVGASANAVREWAKANGYEVSERGRIPADVREAFEAANN